MFSRIIDAIKSVIKGNKRRASEEAEQRRQEAEQRRQEAEQRRQEVKERNKKIAEECYKIKKQKDKRFNEQLREQIKTNPLDADVKGSVKKQEKRTNNQKKHKSNSPNYDGNNINDLEDVDYNHRTGKTDKRSVVDSHPWD